MAVRGTHKAGQGCVLAETGSRLHPLPSTRGVVDEAVLEALLFHLFVTGVV